MGDHVTTTAEDAARFHRVLLDGPREPTAAWALETLSVLLDAIWSLASAVENGEDVFGLGGLVHHASLVARAALAHEEPRFRAQRFGAVGGDERDAVARLRATVDVAEIVAGQPLSREAAAALVDVLRVGGAG